MWLLLLLQAHCGHGLLGLRSGGEAPFATAEVVRLDYRANERLQSQAEAGEERVELGCLGLAALLKPEQSRESAKERLTLTQPTLSKEADTRTGRVT